MCESFAMSGKIAGRGACDDRVEPHHRCREIQLRCGLTRMAMAASRRQDGSHRRSALGCLGTVAALEHAVELAELAMEETHFGVRTNPRITLLREIVAPLRPV